MSMWTRLRHWWVRPWTVVERTLRACAKGDHVWDVCPDDVIRCFCCGAY